MSKLLFKRKKKKRKKKREKPLTPNSKHEEDKRGKGRENKKRTFSEHTKSIANTS